MFIYIYIYIYISLLEVEMSLFIKHCPLKSMSCNT